MKSKTPKMIAITMPATKASIHKIIPILAFLDFSLLLAIRPSIRPTIAIGKIRLPIMGSGIKAPTKAITPNIIEINATQITSIAVSRYTHYSIWTKACQYLFCLLALLKT